jgi:carboxyl-terminal processing protease
MIVAATKAMVLSLDPYSNFLTPEEFASMAEDTQGQYDGIGVEVHRDDNAFLTIRTVYEGGPAFEAGLLVGDLLAAIDSEPVEDLNLNDVSQLIRGDRGTTIVLLVDRPDPSGGYIQLEFSLIRDTVHIEAVSAEMVTSGIARIGIRSFQSGVSVDVINAIDVLEMGYGNPLDGIILDLRSNPGGLLQEGVRVADIFLNDGLVVSTEGRDPNLYEYHQSTDTTRFTGDLVILLNGGSASASEIVAGALQDRQRATLLGTTSYGKGTVQSIFEFEDGSGLKLTTSRYFTPDHRSIHGSGIEPDLVVRQVVQAEGSVENNLSISDVQLSEAVEFLTTGSLEIEVQN